MTRLPNDLHPASRPTAYGSMGSSCAIIARTGGRGEPRTSLPGGGLCASPKTGGPFGVTVVSEVELVGGGRPNDDVVQNGLDHLIEQLDNTASVAATVSRVAAMGVLRGGAMTSAARADKKGVRGAAALALRSPAPEGWQPHLGVLVREPHGAGSRA
jgi:hypothetical protein